MMLFNPKPICDTICEFGKLDPSKIYKNSHKVVFYLYEEDQFPLWNMSIVENTYSLIVNRTVSNIKKEWLGGSVQQSIDLLIKNLGAFHLAVENAIYDNILTDQTEFLQGLVYLKKTYPEKEDLTNYIDKEIIPLFSKGLHVMSSQENSLNSEN